SRASRPRSGVIWSPISRMQSASSNGPRRLRASSRPCASRYVCRTWIANTGRSRSKATTGSCWRRSPAMLTLAFDTATGVATSALVRDGEVLGERASRAARVLADAEELLQQAGADPRDLNRLVVGTGPGSFTATRMGLAAARGEDSGWGEGVAPSAGSVPRGARRRARRSRGGRAAVPATSGRGAGAMKEMTRVELRRLEMRDLNAIERIERASYPTPWSRSMFASELAKPSSICLGAFDLETFELVGYLVISRYVDAWHVMNVAVAAEH